MKERIQKLLTSEGIQPTKFAEIIGVQRSSISHILSGRNKPSFDVIQSILKKFPKINSEWLILGSGDMYKKPIQTSLFDVNQVIPKQDSLNSPTEPIINEKLESTLPESKPLENRINEKDIERVVVFFKDKTFTEYKPN